MSPSRSLVGISKPKIHPFPWIVLILGTWAATSYLLIPLLWKRHYRRHLRDTPRISRTSDGHPGDPANLAIEGAESELIQAMTAAGWDPADPVTLESSLRIAVDSVFRKPDNDAPVSALFLFGRKQDLAFELPVGDCPRQRHHVRFWRSESLRNRRPVWVGSATFDERIGLSHTTGQITHHIAPDVDTERDLIMTALRSAGWVAREDYVAGFHHKKNGRNGGGDPWQTDGSLGTIVLRTARISPKCHHALRAAAPPPSRAA
jgi:hypothetical protein